MKLGLKIRYSEPPGIPGFTPRMVELHLADEDLTKHWNEIIDTFSTFPDMPVVIHAPQNLYLPIKKRPLVDISSLQDKQRTMSLDVVRKTLELSGEIEADYVVAHPGGITPEPAPKKEGFVFRLISSLEELEKDYNTREILMENMPWFYWMWGEEERWYSSILLTPEDFQPVLEYTNVVLDICHAYLSTEEGSNDAIFSFFRKLRGRIKHIHLSDAAAPDRRDSSSGKARSSFAGSSGTSLTWR
ncbi:MAG: TIM barrel protein [Thermoplasmata archaeon]|nr:TIM barrel protein [Thermoplasmata archaeon]